MTTKELKKQARILFKENKLVSCPTFPHEKVVFNSKGLSHLFYKGSRKVYSRDDKEIAARISLLPRALKLLELMPLAQEENSFLIDGKQVMYYAFEGVVEARRIKVIVRQIGNGKKHFWSVIPAWRRIRGKVVNAKGDLSKE